MSKTYSMPKSQYDAPDSNNLVYLLNRSFETTGMKLLKIAADEIDRLHDLIREFHPDANLETSVDEPVVVRMAVVLKVVSRYFNVTVTAMTSTARKIEIINARHMAMYVGKTLTDLSFPQVGAWFDRDHTTVMHAYQKIDELVKTNPKIKEHVDNITAMCLSDARLEQARMKEIELCPPKNPNLSLRVKPRKPQILLSPKP